MDDLSKQKGINRARKLSKHDDSLSDIMARTCKENHDEKMIILEDERPTV